MEICREGIVGIMRELFVVNQKCLWNLGKASC
jgi:hypothetical protein